MSFRNFLVGVGHSISWLLSPSGDIEILNPNFRAGSEEITVECIHGLCDGSHAFRAMAEIIKNVLPDNVKRIRLLSYNKRNQTTMFDAEQTKAKILAYKDKTIVFVAHSHGGLTTATLIEDMQEDLKDKVKILGAIILGTPLDGADLAIFPFTILMPSVAEMRRDSPMLPPLRDKMRFRMQSQKDFYQTIGFGKDALVKNASVCLDVNSHIEIPHTSHLACLYDYATIRFTLLRLYALCGPFTGPLRPINPDRKINVVENCLPIVIEKIKKQIYEMNHRFHVESVQDKEKVLKNLCDILEELQASAKNNLYPNKQTVGEFIEAYLYDINFTSSPYLILSRPKNFSNSVKPTSLIFLQALINEYYDTYLNLDEYKIKAKVEERPNNSFKK